MLPALSGVLSYSPGGAFDTTIFNCPRGTKGFAMRKIYCAIACVIAMTVSAAYGDGLNEEERNFTRAFETFRAKYNLQMPNIDDALVEGSRNWSVRMRTTGSFAHGASRENIYRGQASGVAAFRAWERSPGHRALLLSPNIETFGIGQDGGYWTFRAKARARESVTQPLEPVVAPKAMPVLNQPIKAKFKKIKQRLCCR